MSELLEPDGKPMPDYSDRPTIIVEWAYGDGVYGVQTEGFQLPTGVRVVARDFDDGDMHTNGYRFEDNVITERRQQ